MHQLLDEPTCVDVAGYYLKLPSSPCNWEGRYAGPKFFSKFCTPGHVRGGLT